MLPGQTLLVHLLSERINQLQQDYASHRLHLQYMYISVVGAAENAASAAATAGLTSLIHSGAAVYGLL